MNRRRHDRVLLPGWWKVWEPGPQWSPTARRRIGLPEPSAARNDWQLWESELRQTPEPEPFSTEPGVVREAGQQ